MRYPYRYLRAENTPLIIKFLVRSIASREVTLFKIITYGLCGRDSAPVRVYRPVSGMVGIRGVLSCTAYVIKRYPYCQLAAQDTPYHFFCSSDVVYNRVFTPVERKCRIPPCNVRSDDIGYHIRVIRVLHSCILRETHPDGLGYLHSAPVGIYSSSYYAVRPGHVDKSGICSGNGIIRV